MVILRPLTKEDLPFLLEVRNDYSTRNNLENNSTFTLEECQAWFDNLKSPWYIIEINRFAVGYLRTNGDEIGCDIHPNFRRNGYAKMAYEIYLKDKTYATLWVFSDNFAKNLYKKLGFKETGEHGFVRERSYIKMEWNGKS
jgi:RimJ/RimL family protein N-acetyltransferase